ncbi:hypothetical protein niasHT_039810 [Heterodera trifolii]|uniref:Uncharacterized protein n=1 Tax=Heterodera trifolii TaxID=157864 RepID=A0ABD2J546_9BILA
MAKRNLPHKLNCKRARQKRESKREEQETKLERARQAKFAKKTVQQQQIGHEEGEVETEQQEIDQAEQVEVTYDHAMDFDYHRTLERMRQQAAQFQEGVQNGVNVTQMSKQCAGMQFDAFFNIEPSMTIPPSLHIVACQGVFFGVFKELRHLCTRHGTEYEEQLEMRLRALRAYKNAWYQEYSGYHVRNILRGGGPMHVTEFLPQSPRRDNILVALELLAKLQSFAVADLFSADQIADFRATADQFRVHMLEHFRRHCSTSKFHHLVQHAPEFAENHGFWGLLSEQPVEKFHALFNDDLARKANTKDLHDILMFCARESAIRNAIFDSNEL